MSRSYDARTILQGLVGETIHTLSGRPNRVISVESGGYRSAFIGAVLGSLDDTEASPATMRVRRTS